MPKPAWAKSIAVEKAPSGEAWWKSATAYQIYPASFCDSNGDGIGDIPGIISKLDYLAELGVGFIWLSPVYQSPMVDNGYDISDYQAINPIFGTMADMDRLIAEAKARGIGLVMDLVVNHTSDQHPWFKAACADRNSPYRDYYIWRDAPPSKGAPDDIASFFGGSAWSRDEISGDYYLHLFGKQQPDLAWGNAAMRADIHAMMNWWLDRGIAGFRMDVIDLIGKDIPHGVVSNGPMLHVYLQEIHKAVLAGRDVVTVGESWSATPERALLYCSPDRHELSMIFQFEHVKQFWDPVLGKWKPHPIDWPVMKKIFAKWQNELHGRGWNSLFWSNHDLPRAVSRYGDEGMRRVASAKALATVLHLMQGTPYVYQGEEIGMTNAGFTTIDQYRDLETLNFHKLQLAEGVKEADFMAGAAANGRDNARTPMQWSAGAQAGFTTGKPWIDVNANHTWLNVEADRADPDGVFARYRKLIALRKAMPIIRHGSFRLLAEDHKQIFAYERVLGEERLVVIANVSAETIALSSTGLSHVAGTDLLTGQAMDLNATTVLAPYAAMAISA